MGIFISDMGIACALGQGRDNVAKALFAPHATPIQTQWPLISKNHVPVGSLPFELPPLPVELASLNSRNNRLLKLALDEIKSSVEAAISQYGAARVGVIMATSTSGMYEEERAFAHKQKTGKEPEDYDEEQTEASSPSIFVSRYFGVKGPSYTVSTACSSTGKAICSARRLINSDICDVVITGGVDTLCDLTLNGFDTLELISQNVCNPFSKNRDGITIGEGAAVFLMSSQKSSDYDIELAGCGESSDAYHISCPDPKGEGATVAIHEALQMANLKPSDICYINLHGTGTVLNDSMESFSINNIFGNQTPCSSTKALTGHALGASGALEAAFLWIALSLEANDRVPVPPHIWDGKSDPDLPSIKLSTYGDSVAAINGSYAMMSNSFAFGGSNVSLIFKKQARFSYPVADLLPHSAPMVLIDRLVSYQPEGIHTQVVINDDSAFCENGKVPSYIALEYMAQTVGVWNGARAKLENQSPQIGFLLGARRLDLEIPFFKVGETLDIHGKPLYVDGEMASFECWVEINKKRVVQTGLNVYQPKDINLLGENSGHSK